LTKQRFRVSLGTKRLDEALRKRNRLLRQLVGRRRSIRFAIEPRQNVGLV
jgi:hypothetical protein